MGSTAVTAQGRKNKRAPEAPGPFCRPGNSQSFGPYIGAGRNARKRIRSAGHDLGTVLLAGQVRQHGAGVAPERHHTAPSSRRAVHAVVPDVFPAREPWIFHSWPSLGSHRRKAATTQGIPSSASVRTASPNEVNQGREVEPIHFRDETATCGRRGARVRCWSPTGVGFGIKASTGLRPMRVSRRPGNPDRRTCRGYRYRRAPGADANLPSWPRLPATNRRTAARAGRGAARGHGRGNRRMTNFSHRPGEWSHAPGAPGRPIERNRRSWFPPVRRRASRSSACTGGRGAARTTPRGRPGRCASVCRGRRATACPTTAPPNPVIRPGHAVTEAALAEDVSGVSGVVAELAPQLADGVAHGLRVGPAPVAPHPAPQRLVGRRITD